jgi:hypothetical protein
MEEETSMSADAIVVSNEAEKIRSRFQGVLTKANKKQPRESDLTALRDLLDWNKELKLWEAIINMGALAESQVLDTILDGSGQGMRECRKRRLTSLREDLGYAESPALERLLIQQVTLCWLNLTEYRHSNIMKQSTTFTLGMYWERRLTMAQRRFTRVCEGLARVRRLSRRIPIQVNIAAPGSQQVNAISG